MALPKGFTSGAAAITMPLNGTKDVMYARYNAVGSAETPTRSDVQLVVSKCPGDFDNIVDKVTGGKCAYMGGKTGGELSCQLPAGKYYLNMRHVYPNASWTGPLIPLKDSCGTTAAPLYGYLRAQHRDPIARDPSATPRACPDLRAGAFRLDVP